jgi:hypothetical protein
MWIKRLKRVVNFLDQEIETRLYFIDDKLIDNKVEADNSNGERKQ